MKKFDNFQNSDYMKNISESRYKSHGLKHIRTQFDNVLKKYNDNYTIDYFEDEEIFILNIKNLDKRTLDFILSRTELLGFFPSVFNVDGDNKDDSVGDIDDFINQVKNYNLPKENVVLIQFESWVDKPIKTPEKLYHVCREKNVEKILRYGLYPKAKHKISHHPDRIFLVDNIFYAKDILNQLKMDNEKYVILEIEPSEDILLRRDPNYNVGLYTTQNIAPVYIKKLI